MTCWFLAEAEHTSWLAWLSREYGNLASVAGLASSIAALALTALTYRRAGEAKRFAQQAVARVGSRMLSGEISFLAHFVGQARDAAVAGEWRRVFDRCQDARRWTAPLVQDAR